MQEFDLAVIGAGTGGLVAAFLGDSLGARVALIEKNKVGGECLWTGCVPSKTLIKSARVYETCKRASEFGVHLEKPRVIWGAVRLRIADVRDDIKKNERAELAKSKIEIIEGAAKFEDRNALIVSGKNGEQRILAKKFILATGSKPRIPQIEGLEETGFVTHENIFVMPTMPRSLVFIGGGPIACELAQAFVRFDCKVTILQSDSSLLPHEDADVSTFVGQMLQQDGVTVHLNAKVKNAAVDGERKRVEFEIDGEAQHVVASEIVVAAGKVIDLSDLNVETAGVSWNKIGVHADPFLKAAPDVWVCGDVTGMFLFTHVAEAQGKIAAQNALLPVKKKWDDRVVPWTTFTDPEIARVGLTEMEARAQGGEVKVYRQEFSKLDRAIIEGDTRGFLKVVTAGSGRVLGAHIVGPSAGELIHSFVAAVRDGALIQEFAETIHVYPTLSEIGHRAGNEYFQEILKNELVKTALKKVVG